MDEKEQNQPFIEDETVKDSIAETEAAVEGAILQNETGERVLTDAEKPLDKNVRLLSPTRMILRRFFRSKLSVIGLVIIIALLIFSWLGPVVYNVWGEIETDYSGFVEYDKQEVVVDDGKGGTMTIYQIIETTKIINGQAPVMSWGYNAAGEYSLHILGTDKSGMDIFTRLMYGGRISLTVSFLAVFVTTFIGIIFGGIAGYFGGKVDNVIMRICDILMCLPGFPIMLIIGTLLDAMDVDSQFRIYYLMAYLTLFSWTGIARLVRGQILSLREQEYMVAADAMGYSTSRKIFKHLIPNVLPQLIVSMTLSLGSMILYEATLSYLNLGVKAPYAAWGTMINIVSEDMNILQNYFNIWGPPGICIILAVLGFNFIGDGLRDALDPRMKR